MILHSALQLLKKSGMEAVNIKALAKELHCSTQPVYLSFASMGELREKAERMVGNVKLLLQRNSRCKMFTNKDLINLILPLFVEQFLLMFVGIADTFVVSFCLSQS